MSCSKDIRNWTGSALYRTGTQSGFRSRYRTAEKTEVEAMREEEGGRGLLWQRLLAAAIAAALLSTLIPGLAHPYNKERMDKDIAIMENVINTAMVESEFVYIYNLQNNVRGLHIPEFGALFTLQVQLISDLAAPYFTSWRYPTGIPPGSFYMFPPMDKEKLKRLFRKLDITVDGKKLDLEEYFKHMQDFNRQYFEEFGDVDEDDDNGKEYLIKIRELEEESKEKQKELVEQNLEEFKDELAGLVADYGGTIRQLEDDQWVMIVAYLDPTRGVSIDDEPSKVIVKAKKGDIDLYDFGDIEYEELKSRMVIEVE